MRVLGGALGISAFSALEALFNAERSQSHAEGAEKTFKLGSLPTVLLILTAFPGGGLRAGGLCEIARSVVELEVLLFELRIYYLNLDLSI